MKVLLVDDHALFREGLRLLLERMQEVFEVLEAGDGRSAMALMAHTPDLALVLLDLNLPDLPGLDALASMRECHPAVPVVVISANEDRSSVLEAINRGAMGFIPKSSDSSLLSNALRLVMAKGVYIPASAFTQAATLGAGPAPAGLMGKSASLRDLGLGERQIQVLALLVQGLPNKLIARQLELAEATVKSHVTAALRALNVSNRTQAVLAVGRLGVRFK